MTAPLPGPIDEAPWPPETEARAMLTTAVEGLPLGDYDRRILAWVEGWDSPTIATLASIIGRARQAGEQP